MAGGRPQAAEPETLKALVARGSAALEAERFADALEAFDRASRLAPADPSLSLAAGYAAAMLGRAPDARARLERALALRPALTEASVLLGQVLYREGRLAEAVAVYDAALTHAPRDPALTAARDRWRQELQLETKRYEARGAHFSVRFEGPADDVAALRVVELLEQAYWRIGQILSLYPPEPVTVVLHTREQFHDITRSPAWAGGAYDGRIRLPVAGALSRSADLRRVLDHEYVHALVAGVAGVAVPVWLNEGLAANLEPGGLQWASDVLAAEPGRLPAARLERSFSGLSPAQAAVAYAQSALGVKRLLDSRGHAAVVSLLQALGRGEPFEPAFQSTILMRLEDFHARLARP